MTPNAGRYACARRSANACPGVAGKSATIATMSALNDNGSASRTARRYGRFAKRRTCGTTRRSNHVAIGFLESADDGFNAADDLDIARVDWRHAAILRLQPNATRLAIEALHGRFALDHRHHDLAVACGTLRPHEDEIAVENRRVDHRISLNAQHERIRDAWDERARQHELAFQILLRGDRHAGGHTAENRHHDRFRYSGGARRGAQGARLGRITLDQPPTLKRLEMRVDGRGGRESDPLADLTYRGRVPALDGEGANHVQDVSLPLARWLIGHPFNLPHLGMPSVWHSRCV